MLFFAGYRAYIINVNMVWITLVNWARFISLRVHIKLSVLKHLMVNPAPFILISIHFFANLVRPMFSLKQHVMNSFALGFLQSRPIEHFFSTFTNNVVFFRIIKVLIAIKQ